MPRGQTRRPLAALVSRAQPDWDPAAVAEAIASGRVTVDGRVVTNARAQVDAAAAVRIQPVKALAGRRKLAWAITRFGVQAAGRTVLDVGASTGGFTQAWLDAGAALVYAVDVGHGQLLGSLRQDPRVVTLERTNVADLTSALIPTPVAAVSVDVSYLSLTSAVGQLDQAILGPEVDLLGLVKPMFELRLPTIPTEASVLASARDAAVEGVRAAGWEVVDVDECPVRGGRGAVEYVVHGRAVAGHW